MISFFRSIYQSAEDVMEFLWEDSEADAFEEVPVEIESIVDTPDNSPLVDNQWLNGSEVADYIRRVSEKNKAIRVMEPEYFVEGMPTLALKEKISNENNWLMKLMTSATHIIWPVSKQDHWILLIISKNKDNTEITIRCLDGVNTTEHHNILFENMKAFLQEVFAVKDKKYKYHFKSIKVREQNNGDDCGIVVCHYAEKFCQASNPLSFDEACAKEIEVNPEQKCYLVERKRVRSEEDSAAEQQHIRKKPR